MRAQRQPVCEFIACTLKELPDDQLVDAAKIAIDMNPANRPHDGLIARAVPGIVTPLAMAMLTTKMWPTKGIKLGVAFMDQADQELRNKILWYANGWGQTANVKFMEASKSLAELRLSRDKPGYYSYLGPDALSIPKSRETMNLQDFTLKTPDSEYDRVVPHEFAHAIGAVHEHVRAKVRKRIDPQKAYAYFLRTQGWRIETTTANVLDGPDESQLVATAEVEETSVMAYWLPGEIMRDGKPVLGGKKITALDRKFMAGLYPLDVQPVDPEKFEGLDMKLDFQAKRMTVNLPSGWTVQKQG